MTEPTDEELGELLTNTFRAAESLTEPAGVPNAETRTRRWPVVVAAAASVVLAVGITWTVASRHDSTPPVAVPVPSGTASGALGPTTTYADNLRSAEAESARLIAEVPAPDGATRLRGQPKGWGCCGMSLGPADGSLTKTSWYSSGLSGNEVLAYLVAHPPSGMTIQGYKPGVPESAVGSTSQGTLSLTYQATSAPAAYIRPLLLVQWKDLGAMTVVRFDTYLAARDVRGPATFVTGTVSSVEVSRISDGQGMSVDAPPDARSTVSDADTLGTLKDLVNGSEASIDPPFDSTCPPPSSVTYGVTFHTSSGTVSFSFRPGCWDQIQVSRDGQPITPTLDPGDRSTFVQTVNQALATH